MNQAIVESAISNAAMRMSPEYMNHLDRLATGARGKSGKGGAMGSSDISALDAQVFGYSTPSKQTPSMQGKSEPRQFASDVLRESFSQTPPISGDNFPGAQNMGNTPSGYVPGATLLREQRIAPQQAYVQQPTYVQQPAQYMPQTSGIDYNMIKYLVSEAVKESLGEIKQSLLNESALKAINMPGGNKIQFLDNKGNLYEAQLTLKKKKS